MATVLADEIRTEDWSEPRPLAGAPLLTHAEALWTLFGLTLLGAFLTFASLHGA